LAGRTSKRRRHALPWTGMEWRGSGARVEKRKKKNFDLIFVFSFFGGSHPQTPPPCSAMD
jgi:hypothetical protein